MTPTEPNARALSSLDLFNIWIGRGHLTSECSQARFAWIDTGGVIHCGCGMTFDREGKYIRRAALRPGAPREEGA